jgi:hypothetical protein
VLLASDTSFGARGSENEKADTMGVSARELFAWDKRIASIIICHQAAAMARK